MYDFSNSAVAKVQQYPSLPEGELKAGRSPIGCWLEAKIVVRKEEECLRLIRRLELDRDLEE